MLIGAWGAEKPADSYHHAYWERLQKLNYAFLSLPREQAVAFALRFTLSQPGVCTAIVGSGKPERYTQNAGALSQGPLTEAELTEIRERWNAVADSGWLGQQ